ncbi:MAG: sulfurtransferase-like selenium metabolism protein YedF [Deferrisomatales bacterium]|nr:sulfurtransferase-like selenium metabolism protein YedF [Deferrisomatales bacterium]
MSDLIDCRGLACPEPVLKTKAALEQIHEGVLTVEVDTPASRDNVRRFAESQGCTVELLEASTGGWRLQLAKGYPCEVAQPGAKSAAATTTQQGLPIAILVTSDRIGPDQTLGDVLMRAFLNTLPQAETPPARVLFLNRGVLLTTAASGSLEVLRELEEKGTEVLSCGTCLEFFDKRDALQVGSVSNMYATVETLTGGYRVVTLT